MTNEPTGRWPQPTPISEEEWANARTGPLAEDEPQPNSAWANPALLELENKLAEAKAQLERLRQEVKHWSAREASFEAAIELVRASK